MKKILIVIPSWHGGGAEFVARNWAKWLAGRGIEVLVVLTGKGFPASQILPAGMSITDLTSEHGLYKKTRALSKIIKSYNPSVALSLQSYPNIVLLLASRMMSRKSRPKVVVSERNIVSIGMSSASIGHRAKVTLARLIYRRADHVVAISHAVAAELVSWFGVPDSKCSVIPNPAISKVLKTSHTDHRVGGNEIRLVLPSRIVEQKRPILLLEVASELTRRGYQCSTVIFGDGPMAKQVKDRANELAVILELPGWKESWFENCGPNDIVLLPSIKEGLANVLIEAAAVGIPSVAGSRALGVSDAIIPGITGELALLDTVAEYADAVERANGIQILGCDSWLDRFSAESSGESLRRLLVHVQAAGRSS